MKNRLPVLLGIAAFLLLCAGQAFAHHAFFSTYDHDKLVKIEGTIKEFIWRNPHSFVRVEAPDDKGDMQTWVIEWAGPTVLAEKGVNGTTLRAGDKVIIEGHPGRVAENHRMQLQKVERPSDGWKWEGNSQ